MPLTGNTDFFHGASGGSVDTDKIDTVDKRGGRNLEQFHIHGIVDVYLLTSSLGHPKIFVKEFFNGFMAFHNHCSGQ